MSVAAKHVEPCGDPDEPDTGSQSPHARVPSLSRAAPLALSGDRVVDGGVADDAALLAEITTGNGAAFASLMQRHLSAVMATTRRIVRDEAEAEDITQEAFLRLWNTAKTLEAGPGGLRAWLRRVASNLAIDWLRKAKRLDVTDDVPEQSQSADQLDALQARDVTTRVAEALNSLPPRQRIAVALFHFDDMSQREVAEIMDLSQDALESLLARGRRRLRVLLHDDWRDLLTTPRPDQ